MSAVLPGDQKRKSQRASTRRDAGSSSSERGRRAYFSRMKMLIGVPEKSQCLRI